MLLGLSFTVWEYSRAQHMVTIFLSVVERSRMRRLDPNSLADSLLEAVFDIYLRVTECPTLFSVLPVSARNLSLGQSSVSRIGFLEGEIAVIELPRCIIRIEPRSCRPHIAILGGVIGSCSTILAMGGLATTGRMFEGFKFSNHELEELGEDWEGAREDDGGHFGATFNTLAG